MKIINLDEQLELDKKDTIGHKIREVFDLETMLAAISFLFGVYNAFDNNFQGAIWALISGIAWCTVSVHKTQ